MTKSNCALALLAAVNLFVAGSACQRTSLDRSEDPPTVAIDFSKRTAGAAEVHHPASDRPLRIAVAGMVSPVETLRSYQGLIDYLGRKIGAPVGMKQRKTYQEVNELLEKGELDAAFLCSGGYVHGGKTLRSEIVAVPVVVGKSTYQAYVIVHRDSPIRDFNGLRGHSFAFTDPLSNSGWLYPASRLNDLGDTPSSFFSRVTFTYAHDRSIEAVAQKIVDGASVDSLVYAHLAARAPERIRATRIIERSPPFGIPPFVTSPVLDRHTKDKLKIALLTMHEQAEGVQILRELLIDRFAEADDGAYQSVRDLVRKVGSWRP
ncbi:MAG: phosphate/phosphite/phosphonate ABC transporter substrate-binding protein [Acidobacteriota bacterium]